MPTPTDGTPVLISPPNPADVLLDAEGLAARYGICVDVARRLFDVDGFPSISVSDRRRLAPLVALRHWELVTSLPSLLALLEPPTAQVLAPPAHGRSGRPRKVAA